MPTAPVLKEAAEFRSAVRSWRKTNGLPRVKVVKGLDISPQQLAAIENGESNPSHHVLIGLRQKMGLPGIAHNPSHRSKRCAKDASPVTLKSA